MIKEELNNIDNPLPNEEFTAAQAIQAINRLLWSDGVEDDDFEDARVIKAFIVSVIDEMAAISSAHNSLHDRYVQALAEIDILKATIASLERQLLAAHDNR
jgi:hypothetical protein